MFKCFVCSKKYNAADAILSHIRFFHSNEIAQKRLICCEENCVRIFNNFSAYSKHMKKKHNLPTPDICLEQERTSSAVLQHSSNFNKHSLNACSSNDKLDLEMDSVNNTNLDVLDIDNSIDFDKALTNAIITYIASLYDNSLFSEDQIQKVTDSHRVLLGAGFLKILKEHVLKLLNKAKRQENISNYEVNEVTRMIDSCQNMFSGFETHHLRMKEFESCGSFIKPETYVIETTLNETNCGGNIAIVPTLVHGQYIPLRSVLKTFLELPNVLKIILDYKKILEDNNNSNIMCNIIQGQLWREKIAPKFVNKTILPLILYFDDYETNKELGTHTGVHKLGATYCKIACLPPQFNSLLENIQ